MVLCEPCDELTRSVNGRLEGKSVPPRAPLKSFSLQDEPVDEHGATYNGSHATMLSRHPFKEGLALFPRLGGSGSKLSGLTGGPHRMGSGSPVLQPGGNAQSGGGMQGLSRQHSGQRVVGGMAPYTIGGEGLAGAHNGGYGTAGVGGAPSWDPFQMVGGITPQQHQYQLQQHRHQSQQRGLLTPFHHQMGGVAPPPMPSLVSQGGYFMDENGISRGSSGERTSAYAWLPGPHLDGLMRNPSHSSNGSDPIGMYMNFDSPEVRLAANGSNSRGSGGSDGLNQGGSNTPPDITGDPHIRRFTPGGDVHAALAAATTEAAAEAAARTRVFKPCRSDAAIPPLRCLPTCPALISRIKAGWVRRSRPRARGPRTTSAADT